MIVNCFVFMETPLQILTPLHSTPLHSTPLQTPLHSTPWLHSMTPLRKLHGAGPKVLDSNNQKGQCSSEDGPWWFVLFLSPLRKFGQGPSCSPRCLVSQSAVLNEKSPHGWRRAKCKAYCLVDDPRVILSTLLAFYYSCSRGDDIIWAPGCS